VHPGIWWGNLKERDYSNDVDVDGMIILKWIINRMGGCGLDLSVSEYG
jgi:hypothetical protein